MLLNSLLVALLAAAPVAVLAAPVATPGNSLTKQQNELFKALLGADKLSDDELKEITGVAKRQNRDPDEVSRAPVSGLLKSVDENLNTLAKRKSDFFTDPPKDLPDELALLVAAPLDVERNVKTVTKRQVTAQLLQFLKGLNKTTNKVAKRENTVVRPPWMINIPNPWRILPKDVSDIVKEKRELESAVLTDRAANAETTAEDLTKRQSGVPVGVAVAGSTPLDDTVNTVYRGPVYAGPV